ncbi:MAG: hypothetical protein MUF21_05550 [Gemmatimonadaceae bacterium]|jgi:hypothetical protein|nr:hypothetical protein [Gemmatimonadaceae bacterium]
MTQQALRAWHFASALSMREVLATLRATTGRFWDEGDSEWSDFLGGSIVDDVRGRVHVERPHAYRIELHAAADEAHAAAVARAVALVQETILPALQATDVVADEPVA